MTSKANVADKRAVIGEAWHRGLLRWKIRKHQLPIYNALWNAIDGKNSKYVVNCARRFGKTTVLCIIALEYALRKPKSQIRFAAPSAKQLEKIIFPIIAMLCEDCPEDIKPKFNAVKNVYTFHNGSEIHLAGVDAHHAESLRGVASNLNILDEAGSMDNLRYVMQDVLMPLTLTTGGTTLLASTPAPSLEHDYTKIAHEAKEEGKFIQFTIDDNKSLTPEQRARAIEDSGGEDTTTYRREYKCEFVTDTELLIIPEWSDSYVHDYVPDQYYEFYHKYIAMDIGFTDYTAILFALYDFSAATLHIEDELQYRKTDMVTDFVAADVKSKEEVLWNNKAAYRRIADNNDPRLIQDFSMMHGLTFTPVENKDTLEVMVNKVRMWVRMGRITVSPKCVNTIGCLQHGIWEQTANKRSKFAKSDTYHHYDHLAALIYLVRYVDERTNPIPPLLQYDPHNMHRRDRGTPMSDTALTIRDAFTAKYRS